MSSRGDRPRRPVDWVAPGPQPHGSGGDPELQPRADEDLSYLAGDWRIFQPKSGHRWSLDDLLTAYVAVDECATSGKFAAVDLGCGLGSVLMLIAWAFPECHVTGIEAQPTRAERAKRSLRYNGAASRCTVIDGDIRQLLRLEEHIPEPPRLITGTPPYFDLTATNLSHDPEAAACRAEVRGGLEVYLDAAVALMPANGSLVLCYPHVSAERATRAAAERNLALASRLTVIPAIEKEPLIVVDRFVGSSGERPVAQERRLVVRDANGDWTEDFRMVRRRFGMPERPPRV